MSFTVGLEYTWYDTYKDPDELTRVQQAITANLPVGAALDWEALLAASTIDTFTVTFGNDETTTLEEALEMLTGDSFLAFGDHIEIVPVPIAAHRIVLEPDHPGWKLYSAQRLLQRWENQGEAFIAQQKKLAAGFKVNVTTNYARRQAHANVSIAQLCQQALQHQVPVLFHWWPSSPRPE